jgi:hypothetical protein
MKKRTEAKGEKYLPGHNPGSAKGRKKLVELKKKGKGEAQGVRTCRVCGCTDGGCTRRVEKTGEPCHWVEEDLCSACAEEQDNYPFSPDPEEDEDGG